MSRFLADSNVLVALVVSDHVHHAAATRWFADSEPTLATCPITQGALLRFLIREGTSAETAAAVLTGISAQPWHAFWPDDLEYTAAHLTGVIGHRQVTDACLAALARHHGAKVATFDVGFAASHPDTTLLLAR